MHAFIYSMCDTRGNLGIGATSMASIATVGESAKLGHSRCGHLGTSLNGVSLDLLGCASPVGSW